MTSLPPPTDHGTETRETTVSDQKYPGLKATLEPYEHRNAERPDNFALDDEEYVMGFPCMACEASRDLTSSDRCQECKWLMI